MSQSMSNQIFKQQKEAAFGKIDIEQQAEGHNNDLQDDKGQNLPGKDWKLSWLEHHKRRNKDDLASSSQANPLRIQAIELLFGLSAANAAKWPGIHIFFNHLERCFEQLLESQFDVIWKILSRSPASTPVDCWHWCFAVVQTFQILQDDNASIEKAYQKLIESRKMRAQDFKADEKMQILRAIFAVLCWMSATLKPLLDDEALVAGADSALMQNFCLVAENSSQIYRSKDLRRPIHKMFYFFRYHIEDVEGKPQVINAPGLGIESSNNDLLYESTLNFFSLFTIGRVRLKWVDTLTAHLAFDRSTRTLSIFRFPSLCVANVLSRHNVSVLTNITAKLLLPSFYADSPQEPSAIYREVLLSYMLLFGQSSKARKLLSKLLSQSSRERTPNHPPTNNQETFHLSGNQIINNIDPFLLTICNSPRRSFLTLSNKKASSYLLPSALFPSSTLDINNHFQESDTYSVRDDFPIFGHQLLALQQYNMRRQPSKIKDLWRDRRNPLQWYTFWAVLWIGGLTLILSILQLLLAAAQVYIAVRAL